MRDTLSAFITFYEKMDAPRQMSVEPLGDVVGRVVNTVAEKSGRVKQFPQEEDTMNQVAKVEPEEMLPATSSPSQMLAWALTHNAAPDVIGKFMDLAERFEKRAERKAFDQAISAAKAAIPVVSKNKKGHSGRYADFAALARAVDPIITQHGLHYRFRTVQDEKLIHVTCILGHEAGHFEENTLVGPADTSGSKNAIQAIGSTLTYLQRYTLTQALGLAAAEDDDGKAAGVSTEAVDDQQLAALREMLEVIAEKEKAKIGPTIANFVKFLKIPDLSALPATRYEEAMGVLRQKQAALA